MIVLAGLFGGGAWGAMVAKRRGGGRADMAQFAAGYGIAFAILGLFLTIAIDRLT